MASPAPSANADFTTSTSAPDTPTASMSPTSGSARRPTRKSTLTQQQKNQKRQRATQDQLVLLEIEFEKNPTPTAVVRERIASEINMTERSVQIWFQNRRAKIKNLVKKSIENGEDTNDIPESMRRYLAMQALETGKSLGRDFIMPRFGAGNMHLGAFDSPSSKVVIHHFTCRSLTVGSWRRIGQSAMDLVVFYSPEKETVTYYINNDSAGYKIEYPFSYIKNITLDNGDPASSAEGASQQSGGLIVELLRPPHFYMDSSGSGGFYEVGDFTEDQQASKVFHHYLGGQGKVLSGQLARLVQLEPYQNRHRRDAFGLPQDPKLAMHSRNMGPPQSPAMVTPIVHRPASQPNHFIDDSQLNVFHGTPVGLEAGLQPPRGHKRQRSRSVPVAIDWSMLRHPMPSFLAPPAPSPFHHNGHDMIAPIPMYSQHGVHQQTPMPLTIDTSASFSLNGQYPMSATTAPSPSDFGTPAFFSSAPGPESVATSDMATPFSLSLMSPMPDSTAGPQMNMNHMNGSDPVIANQSPPLTSLGHGPGESELYHIGHDGAMISEDGLNLQSFEWETKQPVMTLPMRPTGMMMDEQHNQSPGPVAFLDPANLNDNSQM
ncbi:hypothetical protein BT63DRAFT_415652 [Microthyrium microscopicum]|uniref:Homeobox domain-containing protein n=1 Tax=Microthyrium microscopicum TaxID=703497 RepID=A0A6A6U5V8_9PEZI|nr:hypothetical protein BT63DRAFT_415652 [Microthyrium microscopicum]